MTSRQLKIFAAVADHASMSKAAVELQITQPSVSQAISEIERQYGVLLFERINRRLYLTETGRRFLPYAKQMLALEGEVDEFLRNASRFNRIRIGATLTVGTCVISGLAAELERRIPDIRVEVTVSNTWNIEHMLLDGELDIGLVEGRVSSPELQVEHVIEDTLVFICSKEHPCSGRPAVSIRDLAGQPLILRERGSGTRAQVEQALRENEIRADVRWDCCNTEAILNAVGCGHGVSVLSRLLVEGDTHAKDLWMAEVSDVDFRRYFDLVYYRGKMITEPIETFMRICREFDSGGK